LPSALQILEVSRTHVRALEVIDEDLSDILPAIDDVSRQMIQPDPGGIRQVDQEEMDDERVIIRSARVSCEVVILQPDAGVSFAVILDDVAWRMKTLWQTSIAYGTSKRLRAWLFKTESKLFAVVMAPTARVSCDSSSPGWCRWHTWGSDRAPGRLNRS
jgi:hypothetical protein